MFNKHKIKLFKRAKKPPNNSLEQFLHEGCLDHLLELCSYKNFFVGLNK